MRDDPLYGSIEVAFVWIAAFCLATGIFLALTPLLDALPATEPVAVGLVTIERYSKLRDYAGAALFFLLVPPLTIVIQRLLRKLGPAHRTAKSSLLVAVPLCLPPLLYVVTGNAVFYLAVPLLLALLLPRAVAFVAERRWLRDLFSHESRPYHALLFAAACGWLLLRYLVVARPVVHGRGIVAEIGAVVLLLTLFWLAAIFIARLAQLNFGRDAGDRFRQVTLAAMPLIVLPCLAAVWIPLPHPRGFVVAALLTGTLLALRTSRRRSSGLRVRRLTVYLFIPALIYTAAWAAAAHLPHSLDGESLGMASDYLRGKVPFRDVLPPNGMMADGQLDAWLMHLFGRSDEVVVMRVVTLGAFLPVAAWYLGIALFRSVPLALLSVVLGSWPGFAGNAAVLHLAAVALFWIGLSTRKRAAVALSGLVAGAALFFTFETGIYAIAGALFVSLLLRVVATRAAWEGLPPLHAAGWFVAGALAAAVPFIVYLASNRALGEFVATSVVMVPRISDAISSLPFPDLVTTFRKNLNLHTLSQFVLLRGFNVVIAPLAIAIAAATFIHRLLQRRVDMLDHATLVIAVFALFALRPGLARPLPGAPYFAAFLTGPLIVLLAVRVGSVLREVWREGGGGTRASVTLVVVAAVPLIALTFWRPDLLHVRLYDLTHYYYRAAGVQDRRREEGRSRVRDVAAELRRLTPRDAPIFDFSNQPALYFYARRPNPTRFYEVPLLSPPDFQAETIRALERAKPRVVIRRAAEPLDADGVSNELRAQAVTAYIDDTYRFHERVRGVELWVRRPGARPRSVRAYLDRVRLPDPKARRDLALARMVFPAVGSTTGVGESYWQSDLTMHNPFGEAIGVTLRYVTGDAKIDQRLTIAPRQTLRWRDVVATLFGRRGTVGTLWIEHRQARAPVAVIRTADVAHDAAATVDQPLTSEDAVSAGEKAGELAIFGIPAAPAAGRRVNLGMVNLGTQPAMFRISAATRSGEPAGGTRDIQVPEDRLWLLSDIESAIGVRLDGTVTLEIAVLAGTGVAYATTIESTGDSKFIAAIPVKR